VPVAGLLAGLQVMLNPFHAPTTRITSKTFDQKVRVLAKRLG
jgi:hypothetical protein